MKPNSATDTPETDAVSGANPLGHVENLKSLARRLECERNEWKRRFADAVERLEGKLHCADGCKCSARSEVNQLRALIQSPPDETPCRAFLTDNSACDANPPEYARQPESGTIYHAWAAFVDIRQDRRHEFPDYESWICSDDAECRSFRQGWNARGQYAKNPNCYPDPIDFDS